MNVFLTISALLVSVTHLAVCIVSPIPRQVPTHGRDHFLPDWSVSSLCKKLREEYNEDQSNALVLVPIQGASTKPKIFRHGCFLLQSKNYGDEKANGVIDLHSRYFVPRSYSSIYNNKKLRCVPFTNDQMPEYFTPFNETVVRGLEALQICKFFSQTTSLMGEKRFVPKFMPIVLNVESPLRCIQWAFDFDELETWVKQTIRNCKQPTSPVMKPSSVQAMSEASCHFEGREIVCKPVDKLLTKIARVNLVFANRLRASKDGKRKKSHSQNRNYAENNEVIEKYFERKRRRQIAEKIKNNKIASEKEHQRLSSLEVSCQRCKTVTKTTNGNFKLSPQTTNKQSVNKKPIKR